MGTRGACLEAFRSSQNFAEILVLKTPENPADCNSAYETCLETGVHRTASTFQESTIAAGPHNTVPLLHGFGLLTPLQFFTTKNSSTHYRLRVLKSLESFCHRNTKHKRVKYPPQWLQLGLLAEALGGVRFRSRSDCIPCRASSSQGVTKGLFPPERSSNCIQERVVGVSSRFWRFGSQKSGQAAVVLQRQMMPDPTSQEEHAERLQMTSRVNKVVLSKS